MEVHTVGQGGSMAKPMAVLYWCRGAPRKRVVKPLETLHGSVRELRGGSIEATEAPCSSMEMMEAPYGEDSASASECILQCFRKRFSGALVWVRARANGKLTVKLHFVPEYKLIVP